MSKHETPMLEAYWQQVGGTLITEFPLVLRSTNRARRLADGLILPNRERRQVHWREAARDSLTIDREEVVVVQVKASRLGMYVMGQALFSAELLRKRFPTAHIRSVILCTEDDTELRALLVPYGIEVVTFPAFKKPKRPGQS